MASKVVVSACVVFALFDVITAQVIKNLGCGCGGVDVIPNQVFLNQGFIGQPGLVAQPGFIQPGLLAGNVIPSLGPNVIAPGCVNGQYALPGTNIIQDNSVATNLANTLQLLLVSNLLSNTLPNSPDVLTVPACSPYAGGLSYIC